MDLMQQMGVNVARLPVMWMAAAWELSGTLGGRKQLQVDCRQFATAKASTFNKVLQSSTNGMQRVQYQSVRNNKFQQSSTRF